MTTNQFGLTSGKWLVANCGKYPSEKNCQLVLMAPESKRSELIEAVADHAVKHHGHENNDELRKQLNDMIETVTI